MKRKYTRKVSPDNVQSKSSPVKGESSINLPPYILEAIESIRKLIDTLALHGVNVVQKQGLERLLK